MYIYIYIYIYNIACQASSSIWIISQLNIVLLQEPILSCDTCLNSLGMQKYESLACRHKCDSVPEALQPFTF